MAPVQAKVEAIMELEPPDNKKGMRRFLGMASYYRRFVKNFADPYTILQPKRHQLRFVGTQL